MYVHVCVCQVIKALQTQHRTETQWGLLVDKVIHLEDVARNQVGHERRFKASFRPVRSHWQRCIYNPTLGESGNVAFTILLVVSMQCLATLLLQFHCGRVFRFTLLSTKTIKQKLCNVVCCIVLPVICQIPRYTKFAVLF